MLVIESPDKNIKRMTACAETIVDRLHYLPHYKPSEKQKRSLKQKIALMQGKYPVAGVVYDTLNLVKRIDYKIDNEFVSKHGLMMQKEKDLRNMTEMFSSLRLPDLLENINNNFEKEFVEDSENLESLDGENQAIQGLAGMYKFVQSIGTFMDQDDPAIVEEAITELTEGQQYMISSDNTMLLIMLQPSVSMNDWDDLIKLGKMVIDTLHAVDAEYDDLTLGASGIAVLANDEMEALKKDFGWSSVIALVLILVLLVGSFRSWKNPFFAVTSLIVSLIWVTGLLALIFKYLNQMSASFGIILIGLGIDFGIHIISGFKDGKDRGLSLADSIAFMYEKVGNGVITGAVTTSIVFLTLALTRFSALVQMGVSMFVGILCCLFIMLVLLPTLIVWDNKGYSMVGNLLRKIKLGFLVTVFNTIINIIFVIFKTAPLRLISSPLQFRFLEQIGKAAVRLPVAIGLLVFTGISVYLSIQAARNLSFEYDMMELEPEGIPAVINQKKILDRFEISPDYAMLSVSNIEEGREKIKKFKKLASRTNLIGRVDGISEFLPSAEEQEKVNQKLVVKFAREIQALPLRANANQTDVEKILAELTRFHQNIVEIGELSISGKGEDNKIIKKCDDIVGKTDAESKVLAIREKIRRTLGNAQRIAEYQSHMMPLLKKKLLKMSSPEIITLDNLSTQIKEQYVSNVSGNYLITVYPKDNVWDEIFMRKFKEMTEAIDERITGAPVINLLFIDLIKEKGRLALLLGLIAILIFLTLDFRSIHFTLFACVPLFVGICWMLGGMAVLGMKLNYSNFMALPLILGIGIDDSVHILHRYRLEGRNSLPTVMHFTGKAILLTSLTTMIGFGSMGLASHRGVASMGQVLCLGVGAYFLASVIVLPTLLSIYERVFDKN